MHERFRFFLVPSSLGERLSIPVSTRQSIRAGLAAIWRLASSRAALVGSLAGMTVLVLSALAVPTVYVTRIQHLGLAEEFWPDSLRRFVAALGSALAPWGQMILAFAEVAAAARASRHIQEASAATRASQSTLARGTSTMTCVEYSEVSLPQVRRRLRLALALFGYRCRPLSGGRQVILQSLSTRHALYAAAHFSATFLLLSLILWPKLAAVEVSAPISGSQFQMRLGPAGLLRLRETDTEKALLISRENASISLRRHLPVYVQSSLLTWHASGPAVTVEATDPNQLRGMAAPSRARQEFSISFLGDETAKYITLPQGNMSLRLSLEEPNPTAIRLDVLSHGSAESTSSHSITAPTTLQLSGMAVTLVPTKYHVLSSIRAPLAPATFCLAVLMLASLILALLIPRATIRLSFGKHKEIAMVETELFQHAEKIPWWYRLVLRLALR